MGLFIQSSTVLLLDFFAERRGEVYLAYLRTKWKIEKSLTSSTLQFPNSHILNHRIVAALVVNKGSQKPHSTVGLFLCLLALGNFIFRQNNLN